MSRRHWKQRWVTRLSSACRAPRQTGKSTLAQQLSPERAYFSLDDAETFSLAQTAPAGFVAALPERVTGPAVDRLLAMPLSALWEM
ncbi:hypothetical protein OPIT5_08075 [Opitutaceae bacterium TAV5]|nr:hypothetical protein OPIT5_08075 [Opitutaceae bacterium TAV5]